MKILPVALTTAAVGALLLVGAAPASAAGNQIEPGDSLYAINCDTTYFNWQLLSVDASTAISTKVGDGDGYTEAYFACAFQPAYNPATGSAYYIQAHYAQPLSETLLATIDVATGESTTIDRFFTWDGDAKVYPWTTAMAIGLDGAAYALTEEFGEADTTLWSIDLTTGELTPIGHSLVNTWAFALDPTTGLFYAVDSDNLIFRVDVTDGSFEGVGALPLDPDENDDTVYSLQIDGGGQFWVMVDTWITDGESDARLWSFTLDSYSTPVYSGIFTDDPYYTEALLIIPGEPEPVLPATGASVTAVPIAAAGLLLGGVVLVALRRRAARA